MSDKEKLEQTKHYHSKFKTITNRQVLFLIQQAEKVERYEEALNKIAKANNPITKASCPRVAREVLFGE
jgi:hypothetical protein